MATFVHCDRDGCKETWKPDAPRIKVSQGSHVTLEFCSFACAGKFVNGKLKEAAAKARDERRWAAKMARRQAQDKARSK